MSRRSSISFLAALLVIAAVALSGCGPKPEESLSEPVLSESTAPESGAPEEAAPEEAAAGKTSSGEPETGEMRPSGLRVKDEVVGKGREAKSGDTVSVHYTGWLESGSKFDSSRDSGQPFQFVLGQGEVIQGWDEGVAGMKVGGKRQLIIPPTMGYGEQGSGPIPPNAVLVFEVELLAVN